MNKGINIAPGVRVRCRRAEFEPGPRVGWVGTVVDAELEDELFVVVIAWDELLAGRAARRQGDLPVHVWAFDSEKLAGEFLEVVSVGSSANA